MSTIELLRDGFASALSWGHLLWALAGVTLGTAVGVLPGIGPALTVALLLPITFNLDPTSAFIMFGGIYYGAMYGGSTKIGRASCRGGGERWVGAGGSA